MSLNRKVSGREMRRHNMAVVSATESALAALEQNAAADRARITAVEGRVLLLEWLANRSLVGRLRWLVTGK